MFSDCIHLKGPIGTYEETVQSLKIQQSSEGQPCIFALNV